LQKAAPTRQSTPQSTPHSSSGSSVQQLTRNTWFHLQSNVGNQAMSRLLRAGIVQAKLNVSQTGDAGEAEADRAAEKVVAATHKPIIQRKCACGGTCSKCSDEDEQQRVPRLQLSSLSSHIQRAAKDGAAQPTPSSHESEPRGPARGLIVEDGAPLSSPGQMKKSAFFALLEADICATADAELAAVGRSTKSCPYIEKWLAFYRGQSAAHIERALIKYAPEAAEATTARDYIRDIRQRVRRAVAIWAKTGRVTGIPPGVGLMPSRTAGGEQKEEGFGTGLLRAVSGARQPQFKEKEGSTTPATDAESVRSQLGRGRALDSPVRSRMESAFGRDFSSVRIHDDGSAGNLSSHLNARAFTIGNDVAFGSGEYKPGTLVGDALIAHELAHVVQQGAAAQSNAPMLKGNGDYNALEADADVSAVGAVASLWAGAKGRLSDIGRNASPRLKSGLKLQRCFVAAAEVGAEVVAAEVVGTEVVVGTGAVTTGTVGTKIAVVGGIAALTQLRDEPSPKEEEKKKEETKEQPKEETKEQPKEKGKEDEDERRKQEILHRSPDSREGASRLGRKAEEAEMDPRVGIHGVSSFTTPLQWPHSKARRRDIEAVFPVHNTLGPTHRTIQLPKPVTSSVADLFNKLFGRS
jgi:hypothetical protein